jgi:hypothetical protein
MMERDMNIRSMAAGFLLATLTTIGAHGDGLGGLLRYAVQCAAASAAAPAVSKPARSE